MQDLSIIIVNYRLKEDTAACIESFLAAGAHVNQFIVVDNHSADGSVEYLQAYFGPALQIVESADNRGYAAGLNIGLRRALQGESAFFILVNNDTIVTVDFLIEMENAMSQGEQFSLFGPMILFFDRPDTVWFLGGKLIHGTMIGYHPFRLRKSRLICLASFQLIIFMDVP